MILQSFGEAFCMSFWSSEKTFGLSEDKDIASRRHLCLLVFLVFLSLFGLLKRPKRPKKTLCDFTDELQSLLELEACRVALL